jgi:hypothetical protein
LLYSIERPLDFELETQDRPESRFFSIRAREFGRGSGRASGSWVFLSSTESVLAADENRI